MEHLSQTWSSSLVGQMSLRKTSFPSLEIPTEHNRYAIKLCIWFEAGSVSSLYSGKRTVLVFSDSENDFPSGC